MEVGGLLILQMSRGGGGFLKKQCNVFLDSRLRGNGKTIRPRPLSLPYTRLCRHAYTGFISSILLFGCESFGFFEGSLDIANVKMRRKITQNRAAKKRKIGEMRRGEAGREGAECGVDRGRGGGFY